MSWCVTTWPVCFTYILKSCTETLTLLITIEYWVVHNYFMYAFLRTLDLKYFGTKVFDLLILTLDFYLLALKKSWFRQYILNSLRYCFNLFIFCIYITFHTMLFNLWPCIMVSWPFGNRLGPQYGVKICIGIIFLKSQ